MCAMALCSFVFTGIRLARGRSDGRARVFCAGMFWNGAPVHRRKKFTRRVKTLPKRRAQKIGFTVDLLGEAVVSGAEGDVHAGRRLDFAGDPCGRNPGLELIRLQRIQTCFWWKMFRSKFLTFYSHISSGLSGRCRRPHHTGAAPHPAPCAGARRVQINFDMESDAHKNVTLKLFKKIFTDR